MPQVAISRLEKILGLAVSQQMRKLLNSEHHVGYLVKNAAKLITPVIPALGLYNVKSVKEGCFMTYDVCLAFGTCSCRHVNNIAVCKHLEAVSLVHLSLATALHMMQQPLPDVSSSTWEHLLAFGALHAGTALLDSVHLQGLRSQV